MSFRSLLLAIGAGIAVAILVGALVSELAQPWIGFSAFLGIPAGLAAGLFTAAAAYLGLADGATMRRRRMADTFAAFGAGFLVALLVFAWLLGVGATVAIVASFVAAFAVAGVVYVRGPKGPTGATEEDGPAGN